MKRPRIVLALVLLAWIGRAEAQLIKKVGEDWTSIIGVWDVDKKGVISGRGFLRYDKDLPPDFIFKASLRLDEPSKGAEGGTKFEIWFRRNPEEEMPTYLLRIQLDSIALIKWTKERKTLDEIKVGVPLDTWIKLELQMKDNKIQARLGKKMRLQAADAEPIQHNKFVISAVGLKAYLKDLELAERK